MCYSTSFDSGMAFPYRILYNNSAVFAIRALIIDGDVGNEFDLPDISNRFVAKCCLHRSCPCQWCGKDAFDSVHIVSSNNAGLNIVYSDLGSVFNKCLYCLGDRGEAHLFSSSKCDQAYGDGVASKGLCLRCCNKFGCLFDVVLAPAHDNCAKPDRE